MSAGEFLHNAGVLEDRLPRIFTVAHHWNALLLLDEANMFLEIQTEHYHFMNGIISNRLKGVANLSDRAGQHIIHAILKAADDLKAGHFPFAYSGSLDIVATRAMM